MGSDQPDDPLRDNLTEIIICAGQFPGSVLAASKLPASLCVTSLT